MFFCQQISRSTKRKLYIIGQHEVRLTLTRFRLYVPPGGELCMSLPHNWWSAAKHKLGIH